MRGPHTSASRGDPCRGSWRLGGENPPRSPRAGQARTGFTILELLVVLSLLSMLLGIALPRMPRGAYVLWNADRQLVADLRDVRAEALTKGDHFRLRVTTANSYEMARLRFVGGAWVADAPYRVRTLPAAVSFTAGVGRSFEFNTRGLMVEPALPASLALMDSYAIRTRYVTVWPSGQVAPL